MKNANGTSKSKTWVVTSAGLCVGVYKAESAGHAIQLMVEDAGYSTIEELCAAGSSKAEEFAAFEPFMIDRESLIAAMHRAAGYAEEDVTGDKARAFLSVLSGWCAVWCPECEEIIDAVLVADSAASA